MNTTSTPCTNVEYMNFSTLLTKSDNVYIPIDTPSMQKRKKYRRLNELLGSRKRCTCSACSPSTAS